MGDDIIASSPEPGPRPAEHAKSYSSLPVWNTFLRDSSRCRGLQSECDPTAHFALDISSALHPHPVTPAPFRPYPRILGMGRKPLKNDSLPGSLDMLILGTLSRRDLHGYGIVQFIQQSSANELLVEEGSLYPALQRLELNGWIEGDWGLTANNRRARIYKITPAGRDRLEVETRQYAKLTLAIARVMGAA